VNDRNSTFLAASTWWRLPFLRGAAIGVLALAVSAINAAAQETPPAADTIPPPLKHLSKSERSQLDAETDVKKRTVLALGLMEGRLSESERLTSEDKFDEMYLELGGFHAIMDDTLKFLVRKNPDDNKTLNNLKRYEIGLRSFIPRLEKIRSQLPSNYDPYVKALVKYIIEAREKALSPFFGTNVVPDEK
jgi:hypothetical protein